jgi:hypothetical protein
MKLFSRVAVQSEDVVTLHCYSVIVQLSSDCGGKYSTLSNAVSAVSSNSALLWQRKAQDALKQVPAALYTAHFVQHVYKCECCYTNGLQSVSTTEVH